MENGRLLDHSMTNMPPSRFKECENLILFLQIEIDMEQLTQDESRLDGSNG